MESLLAGYRQFRTSLWRENRELFARLAQGQSPRAVVIACSDSRVDPQMIFAAAPGDPEPEELAPAEEALVE